MGAKSVLILLILFFSGIVHGIPVIQHWTTTNGARVYFVPAPEIPMVDMQVVFDAGAARDGDKFGLALMTNAVLSEGAGALDADAIAKRFDELGARFGSSSHRDMSEFSLRSLSDSTLLQPVAELMALILTKPTFPKVAFVREKNRVLVSLRARRQSPGKLASEAFYQDIYGTHPYATMPLGTEASVKALTRRDLIDFRKRYFVARNAIIAIVGALDRSQAETLVETLVGRLPAGNPALTLPKVDDLKAASINQQQYPSTQSHVLVGQPGISRGDPDYFPLYLGNHILGGNGLVSRISEEIREQRGLSYSAYSYFSSMRRRGPFVIGLQTRNESMVEALRVLRDVLNKFVAKGPTAVELEAAKKNITGGFALRISSNKKIIEYIAMIGFYGLPLDYLDTFNDRIQGVTLEKIKQAFHRRINPGKMVTVIVGNAPKVDLMP